MGVRVSPSAHVSKLGTEWIFERAAACKMPAQVHFDITTDHPPLVIPGNTLIFHAQGTQVGVVDTNINTVHFKDVRIGRDFGTKLKIVDGLKGDDSVILNPFDFFERWG